MMVKSFLEKIFNNASGLRRRIILDLLDRQEGAKLLHLGCDDGAWSLKLAQKLGSNDVYGLEIVEESVRKAVQKGVNVQQGDINKGLPFKNDFFDVVHADQVIEHITSLDTFVSEIYRVLKPGGYAIISTENASSWHNIFAMVMGWQMFSLTNASSKASIGNPLALHRSGEGGCMQSWTHKVILSYKGLADIFSIYDFRNKKIIGAGYYPLPAVFGKVDPRHSHFITLKAFKPH